MGILCQPVLKTIRTQDLPVPSGRMVQLFYEFLDRYNEWKIAMLQEMMGMLILIFLGLCSLFLPWILPRTGLIMSMAMLVPFYFATQYYLKVNERVSHLAVNVHVLHHHLMGKLEVGFCDHSEPCHCVQDFRLYVENKYNIFLYNVPLR